MWTEAGPLRAMRSALHSALPPRAFLKRDRGDFMLVTNAPAFDPELTEIPGFICERRGILLRILPDEGWIARYERRHAEAPDGLSAGLMRFRGMRPDRENIRLFAQGAKLLDSPGSAAQPEIEAYDRCLRQRAAIALRGGCGGGLYAAALLNYEIQRLKGAKQP